VGHVVNCRMLGSNIGVLLKHKQRLCVVLCVSMLWISCSC